MKLNLNDGSTFPSLNCVSLSNRNQTSLNLEHKTKKYPLLKHKAVTRKIIENPMPNLGATGTSFKPQMLNMIAKKTSGAGFKNQVRKIHSPIVIKSGVVKEEDSLHLIDQSVSARPETANQDILHLSMPAVYSDRRGRKKSTHNVTGQTLGDFEQRNVHTRTGSREHQVVKELLVLSEQGSKTRKNEVSHLGYPTMKFGSKRLSTHFDMTLSQGVDSQLQH